MADLEKTAEEGAAAPVTETKLSDGIRAELGADDITEVSTAAEAGAEGEGGATDKEVTAGALEEALPELTPAQIKALANDPNIVTAVMTGETGKQTLDQLIEEVLSDYQETSKGEAEFKAQVTTIAEAIKKGEEDDDWSDFGKLTFAQLKAEQKAKEASQGEEEVLGKARESFNSELDEVVESVYGDVLNSMTDEELSSLDRNAYPSDKDYTTAVFKALDSKRREMVLSTSKQETADEATKTAEAAAHARARVGIGAIPGGSGVQTSGGSIGDLLREGLAAELGDESD